MIPKECKRLAEVDFPIAEVSKHTETSGRRGHPAKLHQWWARRPLSACRAMLLGLLLPDPCDLNCPEDFKSSARELLTRIMGNIGTKDEDLRQSLFKLIADFADWDVASQPVYLEVSRGLVRAAYPEGPPLVVDPFSGRGSIPLEALRLGCEAYASDLNPVACLILKVMLEDIPRQGPELAEELRLIGKEIREKAEKELDEFYPKDRDGATPIVYLWARTVKCESPNCGAEIPLIRSFWLCKKANRKRALQYEIVRSRDGAPRVAFEIFEPKSASEVRGPCVSNARATCLCCGAVLTPERVRAQLTEQRGGADVVFDGEGQRIGGALMTAVVTLRPGVRGRHYRLPNSADYTAVYRAHERLSKILDKWEHEGKQGLCPVPDELISKNELRRVSVPLYGATTWGDLYNQRQKICIHSYSQLIRHVESSGPCVRLCTLVLGRMLVVINAHCRWKPSGESLVDIFGRHAIGMVWDFAESTPGRGSDSIFSSWIDEFEQLVNSISHIAPIPGQVAQADATDAYLPDESCQVWFTDPPYYDSIPYAHLSDFFYVWHKRALSQFADSLGFSDALSPKTAECVVDRPHRLSTSEKTVEYFEAKIAAAAARGRRVLSPSGCASIVFAHKTTEGWEALLSGIIDGKWRITASWPIATELNSRLNARDTASLQTSVHLILRPRPDDAPVGDWADVLRELPKRVGDWMERLQDEGIRGADLVFACIGPALEIFSRYSKVETADGNEVKLSAYLEKVWEVVGRTALEQVLGTAEAKARNGAAGAVEEDARLTALFLWTLQATSSQRGNGEGAEEDSCEEDAPIGKSKGFSLAFDVVRRFAQPLGIDLPKWEGRIIETEKGVVRLMAVSERAKQLFGEDGADAVADWIVQDPSKDLQGVLFPELEEERVPKVRGRGRRRKAVMDPSAVDLQGEQEATTLDRIHAAMLLQAGGQANALRQLIKAEQDRGPDFLRLANALSALYPMGSEEKRLLDAMLLAVPR